MSTQQPVSEADVSSVSLAALVTAPLITAGLPSIANDSTAVAARVEHPSSAARDQDGNPLPEFIHQYLRDYIALADQKAAFMFAAVAAILAYLVEKKALEPLTSSSWSWAGATGVLAAVACSVAACFAIAVIAPRLSRGIDGQQGVIFWEDIAAHSSANGYSDVIKKLSKDQASDEVRRHCYVLAQICWRKYRILRRGIVSGAIGFGLTVVFIALG